MTPTQVQQALIKLIATNNFSDKYTNVSVVQGKPNGQGLQVFSVTIDYNFSRHGVGGFPPASVVVINSSWNNSKISFDVIPNMPLQSLGWVQEAWSLLYLFSL